MFDEASLWWSPQAILLPDSKETKEQVQKQMEVQPKDKEIQLTQEEIIDVEPSSSQEKARSLDKEKNP